MSGRVVKRHKELRGEEERSGEREGGEPYNVGRATR